MLGLHLSTPACSTGTPTFSRSSSPSTINLYGTALLKLLWLLESQLEGSSAYLASAMVLHTDFFYKPSTTKRNLLITVLPSDDH